MSHQEAVNNWRSFLAESPTPKEGLSDEVLQLIFSDEISKILSSEAVNEGLRDRAIVLAKKYGIPITLALGVLTGTVGGSKLADIQNSKNAEAAASQEIKPAPGTFAAHRSSGLPPGYSDLSNIDSIEKSWEDISTLQRAPAPVSGVAPTMIDGEMRMLRFSYIPAHEISPDTVLPMSLMPAESYRLMLEERLERRPNEIIHLKDMIFGDTGKWASGTGNQVFRVEGNSALLPPEWSIAHEVYATAVEARLIEMVDHVREHPDMKQDIYEQLGVQDDAGFHEFINDQLFKIGRQ